MRYFFFILFGLSLLNPVTNTKTVPDTHYIVIQLFTSQGCSSCPPADALVEKIKKEYAEKNVMILSYHVDYWDRLGWKDPFGKREYTEIQYAYADKFNERNVYTPQIVVNGKEHFIGSDEYILRKKLKRYLKKDAVNSVKLATVKKGNQLQIEYEVNGKLSNKKIVLALVLDKETTQVERGENARKSLSNSNIVIQQKEVTLLKTIGKTNIELPRNYTDMHLIAFIQDDNMNITGGNKIKI